jgi:hypothetical protein
MAYYTWYERVFLRLFGWSVACGGAFALAVSYVHVAS